MPAAITDNFIFIYLLWFYCQDLLEKDVNVLKARTSYPQFMPKYHTSVQIASGHRGPT